MRLIATFIAAIIAGLSASSVASAESLNFKGKITGDERHHLRADQLRRQSMERARAALVPNLVIIQDDRTTDGFKYAALSEQIARLGALVRADKPAAAD